MRASFFDWSCGTKRVFPSSYFLFGAIRVPVRPEITHRLPTKRDAKPLKKYAAASRACNLLSQSDPRVDSCAARDTAAVASVPTRGRTLETRRERTANLTTMLAARRRPGKLPEGFYAAAEKDADRAMHAAVRKESRPRPRPLERNKTDWSHAKIKIGPRHHTAG